MRLGKISHLPKIFNKPWVWIKLLFNYLYAYLCSSGCFFFFNCLNQTFLFLNFIHLLQYWCFGQFICNSLNKILEAQHELLNGSLAKKGRLPKIAHILKCSGNLLPSVQYHKSIWNAFFIFWVLAFTAHFLVNPLPSFCFLNFGLWK